MRKLFYFIPLIFLFSCKQEGKIQSQDLALNQLAKEYVKLGLHIGQYDADFVDAYYGPDSLKPAAVKPGAFPKDSLLAAVDTLRSRLKVFQKANGNDTLSNRAAWMSDQLLAFGRRIRIFSGEYENFDRESQELFGVQAPVYTEKDFRLTLSRLDSLLPGQGSIPARFQALANRFIIPKNKLDTVFKTAIAESRKRTLQHFKLPATESFNLEYVSGKSWSGYNYYKGNYQSLIQINTDMQVFVERAIDVGSHESYPGHHVYNMLLEKNLYKDKGWVEISLYPLFSPQSLIAEGSANYGIEVAFPGNEKIRFAKEVILPLAGLDTAGADLYFKALALKGQLNYARNEAARGLINGTMTETQASNWLMDLGLYNRETALKSVDFIKKYRSYVINYNYGQDLVKEYIESVGGTESAPSKRWELFGSLLSNEVRASDLKKAK